MNQSITIFTEKGPTISETSRKLIEEIKSLTIANEGDEQNAINAREKVRICIKRIDELRKEAVGPLNEQVKQINNQAKFYIQPLESALESVTKVLKDYMDHKAWLAEENARIQKREREEMEKRRMAEIEEAQKKQKELEEKAKQASFEEQENLERQAKEEAKKAEQAKAALDAQEVQLVEEAKKTITTENGAKITRKLVWKWEITDINEAYKQRPDLFILDEKKVNKLVKDGIREIPGIRVFQESNLSA